MSKPSEKSILLECMSREKQNTIKVKLSFENRRCINIFKELFSINQLSLFESGFETKGFKYSQVHNSYG